MSEWWTYRPGDFVMYGREAWLALLEAHNAALFPWQALPTLFGLWLVWAAWRGEARALRAALIGLGACWLFVASAWFWQRLVEIDLAAPWYAYAFAFQGMLLIAYAGRIAPDALERRPRARMAALAATDLGVVVWPILAVGGAAFGAGGEGGLRWGATPLFGVTPDATALATIGVLLALARGRWLLIVPLLWCLISGTVQWHLGLVLGAALPLLAVGAVIAGWVARRADP